MISQLFRRTLSPSFGRATAFALQCGGLAALCSAAGAQTEPIAAAAATNPVAAGVGAGAGGPANGVLKGPVTALRRKPNRPVHAAVYAPIPPEDQSGAPVPEIDMFVGESRVFPAPNVGRIAVGNGQIMTAAALDRKEVIVFANGAGTSSLFVWNADGRYQRIKINIAAGDTSRVAREVATFLTMIPKAKASIVGDKVIVDGDNLADADMAKIEQLEKRYPQIVNFTNRVGWEQMVMMDVKVVEFPKSELREIGLKWGTIGGGILASTWLPVRFGKPPAGTQYTLNVPTTQNGLPITTADPAAAGGTPLPSNLNLLGGLNLGLSAQLNLLEQDGKASILAEPQLSARNGAKASFLAGGEFPYSVSNINGVTIIFKPYGIRLEITPKVDHNGVIRASIMSEVSSIDSSVSSVGGPALLTRKTETEFNVQSGETIVLSGLLQRSRSTDIDKVPLLGDLPVLGAMFRSKRFQNKETELVVFVTPSVVDSHTPGLVNRVERATERLQQQLGAPPFLSDPLQPGSPAGQFNGAAGAPLRSLPGPAVVPAAAPVPAGAGAGAAPVPAGAGADAGASNGLAPALANARTGVSAQATAAAIYEARAPMDALRDQPNASALARPASFVALASVPTVIAAPDVRTSSVALARSGATSAASITPAIAIATVPTTVWIPGPVAQRAGATGVSATAIPQDSRQPVKTTARANPATGKLFVISAHHARLRAAPDVSSRDLLRLEQGTLVRVRTGNGLQSNVAGWVPVVTGNVEGWIVEAALAPSDTPLQLEVPEHARLTTTAIPATSIPATTSTPATASIPAATAAPGHFRVGLAGLALRSGPDTKARLLTMLAIGTLVEALPEPPHGPWTAISAGTRRGWVPTRWLVPENDLVQR